MKKKKVLHVSYGGLGKGGVGSVIFSITENLSSSFDFGCVVFATKGVSEERFSKNGKLHRINCYVPGSFIEKLTRSFRMYFGIKKICKQEHYDVIHCHNGEEEAFGLLAAKHAGIKVRIAHSHNTNSPKKVSILKRAYRKILLSIINRTATVKVACSGQAAHDFYGMDDVIIIPNSIAIDKFYQDRYDEENQLRFVHVGRYDYQKNQEFILDVFSFIHKEYPESSLRLVGFGTDKEMLENKVAAMELGDAVAFVPSDTEIADEYRCADYMIFPSRYEGFGIVLIEAQAAGVYCFGSEAIQPEADAGFIKRLSLEDSAEVWAEAIISHHKAHPRKPYNDKAIYYRYDAKNIASRYGEIYESTDV